MSRGASGILIHGAGFVGRALTEALAVHGVAVTLRSARTGEPVRDVSGSEHRPCVVLAGGHASPGMSDQEVEPAVDHFRSVLSVLRRRVETDEIQHAVLVSSAGPVYGRCVAPAVETDTPSPVTPYGRLKLVEEEMLRAALPDGCTATVLRCTNLFGPQQDASRRQGLVPVVVRRALQGLPVDVYGSGHQRRDYVYLPDLADIVLRVAEDSAPSLLNVAAGEQHSVLDIISTVEDVMGVTIDVRHVPAEEPLLGDQPAVDNGRLRSLMGTAWNLHDLRAGVGATMRDLVRTYDGDRSGG